jgi:EmrB/QacA subfamily drug resistance transporter
MTRNYERRWWILAVLCLSLVLISVSNTSLNVGLPSLARNLHASASQLQWIVDAYSLVFAGLLLTAGSLGDRYGRKRALNVGLVIFGLASGAAAVSTSAGQLVVARGAMGVGAGLVMPATLSVLAQVFPQRERPKAIAIWAGFAGAGGAGGSVLSGWLLLHFWWGSIFLTNIGVALVALAAGAWLIPRADEPHDAPLDPAGAVLSIAALGALIYAVIEAPARGWAAPATAAWLGIAGAFLVAFVWWERRCENPMLDMAFFSNPTFTAATTTLTFIFFTMYGMVFLLTQYLQLVLGLSPLQAGLRILPIPIVFMATAPLSAGMVERWGQRRVVGLGLVTLAAGMAIISRAGIRADYSVLTLGLAVSALGMGVTMAPSTGAIMRSLPLRKAGVGSAVNDATRELGGALGVAVLGSILASQFRRNLLPAIQGLPSLGRAGTANLGAALGSASNLPAGSGSVFATSARGAFVDALHVTLLVAVAVALVAAVFVTTLLGRPAVWELPSAIEAAGDVGASRPRTTPGTDAA